MKKMCQFLLRKGRETTNGVEEVQDSQECQRTPIKNENKIRQADEERDGSWTVAKTIKVRDGTWVCHVTGS